MVQMYMYFLNMCKFSNIFYLQPIVNYSVCFHLFSLVVLIIPLYIIILIVNRVKIFLLIFSYILALTACEKRDNTLPVITLIGPSPITTILGQPYIDQKASASDNKGADLTSKIVVTNLVDISRSGSYQIKYNVSDDAGNKAEEVIRTVIVQNAAYYMWGNYSVTDTKPYPGGTVTTYTTTITPSDNVNNRVIIKNFGTYINGDVYMDIAGGTTSIASQTITCGNPVLVYQFNAPSNKISLNTASPINLTIEYTEIQGIDQNQGRGIYIKQ